MSSRRRRRPLLIALTAALLAIAPAQALQIEEASIADIQAAYRAGSLSTRQVVEMYLARIAAYDQQGPYLNAIINLNPKALEEADRIDAAFKASGKLKGPLHGIPVLVKDVIDADDMPNTSGFQGWKHWMPKRDATLVAKIKEAGGIILGKASTSEFTNGGGDNINSVLPGFARNPYNTAFATGGSSGGTGASIAANFATVGIGTDTGGSVRMPAAHNALAGLRPTVGLVSRDGIQPNNSIRDTAGPMARTVTDLALLLDAIVGIDPADAAAGPVATDPDTIKGLEIEAAYRVAFTRAMDSGRIDAVIFPTWAQLPVVNGDRNTQLMTDEANPKGGVTGLGSSLTFVGSTLQWPALSVPSGYLGPGLPVGLQILGRAWDDAKIIGYAYAYEQATRYRRPAKD
ncbi:amidase [Nevskia sp.]|uniref:amidase n=1 Tax=Nevskia sp. TaxID=1929292 RepID=UPI003F71BCFC